jgi:hypothetical protein
MKKKWTIKEIVAKTGLCKSEAAKRIRDYKQGKISVQRLTCACGYNQDVLPPDRQRNLEKMARTVNSSIIKLDKYFPPLF